MEGDRKPTPTPEEHPPAKVPDGPAVVEQGDNTPAPSGRVIDLADVQGAGGGQEQATGAEKEGTPTSEEVQKKKRGRPPKSQDYAEPPGKARPRASGPLPPKEHRLQSLRLAPPKSPRPSRRPPFLNRPPPAMRPVVKKRRLSISIFPTCTRSRITRLGCGTMRKCRALWSP